MRNSHVTIKKLLAIFFKNFNRKGDSMQLHQLVGHRVILRISNVLMQDQQIVPSIRLPEDEDTFSLIAQIVDLDTHGLWIESKNYPVLNEITGKVESHEANILVKYDYITSIAAFPNLAALGLEEQHRIGFAIEEEKCAD